MVDTKHNNYYVSFFLILSSRKQLTYRVMRHPFVLDQHLYISKLFYFLVYIAVNILLIFLIKFYFYNFFSKTQKSLNHISPVTSNWWHSFLLYPM